MRLVAVLALMALLMAACASPDIARPVPFIIIDGGSSNAPSAQELAIEINSQQDWNDLWIGYFKASRNEVPLEGVNFENETVFAAFLGEKNSGGYAVSITSIEEMNNQVRVRISATSPKKGSMVTQSFTTPYQIVKTKKIQKPASFLWARTEQ